MALYIGDQKVCPFSNQAASWFGGHDAELLYTVTAIYSLDSFLNWDTYSAAPQTSANLVYAPTTYSSASAANVIFDRYGDGYHNGEILDFSKYNYFYLNECVVDAVYTQQENTISAGHSLASARIYGAYLSKGPSCNTSTGVILPDNTNPGITQAFTVFDSVRQVYRSYQNQLLLYNDNAYGFILANASPTFPNTASITCSYVNFRTPTLRMRTAATTKTYLSTTAFNLLDATNTKFKIKNQLFRTNKNNIVVNEMANFVYMLQNKNVPT